jgi:biopolymer transport protein ExbD
MTASPRFTAEPNVTPMIDILLVLLIVFMMMVVQRRLALDLRIPETCSTVCSTGDAIVLEVFPGTHYRVNRQTVAHDALQRYLVGVYASRPEKVLSVTGREGARYADVFEAMDVARAAGVRVISAIPKGL